MNERNTPPYATKVVDLKPRGNDRIAHSQFGHFVPDEELIQSTARIKNQRDLILERLEKMTSSGTRVSKTVFEKVRRDYSLQLETINELLIEKKQLLKEEIKKLYINREKLSFEVNRHREILEEAEFRHFLGEFTQSQYQEVENFETKEIEKLESDLSHISQWVRTHEELFDPEDFGQKRPEKKPVPSVPESRSQETVTAAQPAPAKAAAPQPAPRAPEPAATAPQRPTPDLQKTEKAIVPAAVEIAEEIPEPSAAEEPSESSEGDEFSYLFEAEPESSPEDEASFDGTESNLKELLSAALPAAEAKPVQAPSPAPQPVEAKQQPAAAPLTQVPPVVEASPAPPSAPPAPAAQAPMAKLELTATDAVPAPTAEEEDLFIPDPEDEDYFKQDQDKADEASLPPAAAGQSSQLQEEDSVTASKEALSAGLNPPTQEASRQTLRADPEKPVNRDESISNILDSIRLDGEVETKPAPQADAAAPSDSAEGEFKLILLQGDLDDKVFTVRENTSIGRSPSNDVVLKEPKVSRQHAAINKYNEHYIIIDLKSSNGVYVNGVKVDECVLHLGDEISIGGYKFQFQQA